MSRCILLSVATTRALILWTACYWVSLLVIRSMLDRLVLFQLVSKNCIAPRTIGNRSRHGVYLEFMLPWLPRRFVRWSPLLPDFHNGNSSGVFEGCQFRWATQPVTLCQNKHDICLIILGVTTWWKMLSPTSF